MSWGRSMRSARYCLLAGLLLLAFTVTAVAKPKSSVKIKGPSSVKVGKAFHYKASGFAAGGANFLATFENPGSLSCPKSYTTEYFDRQAGAAYISGYNLKGGKFSVKVPKTTPFVASAVGKHFLCAYLVKQLPTGIVTSKTYAHAHKRWTVHT